jgi:hypothetical protein
VVVTRDAMVRAPVLAAVSDVFKTSHGIPAAVRAQAGHYANKIRGLQLATLDIHSGLMPHRPRLH